MGLENFHQVSFGKTGVGSRDPVVPAVLRGGRAAQAAESAEEEIGARQHVGSSGKHATYLHKLRKCLSKAVETDRKLLMLNRRASGEA
jgi:cation transport regulator ChaC